MRDDKEASLHQKRQSGQGISSHRKKIGSFGLRYSASALVWMSLPAITLLGFRSSPWEALFRAQPYNDSYDAMFIAAMAGIGATSMWAVALCWRSIRMDPGLVPIHLSRWNAFVIFEIFLSGTLAILNYRTGATASSLAWTLGFAVLLITTFQVRKSQLVAVPRRPRRFAELLASILLILFALLFIAFPVFQPWNGPPESFVRWHPFGLATELIWRGAFLSFATGMLISALDPAGRHRLFIVALILSGYLHSAEMAFDNLHSAKMGTMNGNPQHLYGDILGWCTIASLSVLFLVFSAKYVAACEKSG